MTLRDFLKELKVDVWEDVTNVKTLDLDLAIIGEDTRFYVEKVSIEDGEIRIELLNLD